MPIWIAIAVSAALFQSWRTAMQQKLRGVLSVNGAGFVRYLYGMPTALVIASVSRCQPSASSVIELSRLEIRSR